MDSASPELITLPDVPVSHKDFIPYLSAAGTSKEVWEKLEPYKQYDAKIREIFAQQPDEHPAVKDDFVNAVPIFGGDENLLKVRARKLSDETEAEKSCYILPLPMSKRRKDGSSAIGSKSIKGFRKNFALFTESSLADINWSNVVAAGSAVLSALSPIPARCRDSKKLLRKYYHDELAPASDVDLFLYGLTEEEAMNKIKHIERKVRDSLLEETTTVRTKNAITIASKHPVRHVQIVLRIYRSISEILTGFDVDSSCVAYDGKQVYAAPRALAALMTQINTIDLTRRSPSYENRLSKYSHRGFEVYWPLLDRSKIDPTIFERNFARVVGLARLLVLERLPTDNDREKYHDKRRKERGRPRKERVYDRKLYGNIKNDHDDEVPEFMVEDEVSNYHSVYIPYGPKFNAKRIEKLLFTKDLLLNAEWNKPKDRLVHLHRHPAFVGNANEVMYDCCGDCPEPQTMEEEEVAEEESKIYISGRVQFVKDNPGRQAIGSFNPITTDDWTEMAYVSDAIRLCQAITEQDHDRVHFLLEEEQIDPNRRDYTGRTPLCLAVMCSSPEIVQTLIDADAKLVPRLVDGRTALHLAAIRGDLDILSSLMRKSEKNENDFYDKEDARRGVEKESPPPKSEDETDLDDFESEDLSDDSSVEMRTESSYVNVQGSKDTQKGDHPEDVPDLDERDFFDINALDWDNQLSPLHLAILNGHCQMVTTLVKEYGADPLMAVFTSKSHFAYHSRNNNGNAILPLVLPLGLPVLKAIEMVKTLVHVGVTVKQADASRTTGFHYAVTAGKKILETLMLIDGISCKKIINHVGACNDYWSQYVSSPLLTAIAHRDVDTVKYLLSEGATQIPDLESYSSSQNKFSYRFSSSSTSNAKTDFLNSNDMPVILSVEHGLIDITHELLSNGADANTCNKIAHRRHGDVGSRSLLDLVREKIKSVKNHLEPSAPPKYLPLRDDEYYKRDCPKDSYALWLVEQVLAEERKRRNSKNRQLNPDSVAEKPEKIKTLEKRLTEWEELERALVLLGGRTVDELYPERAEKLKDREKTRSRSETNSSPKFFEISFRVQRMKSSDKQSKDYVKLYNAAWDGDLNSIKSLTMGSREPESGAPRTPIQIAVQDQLGFSPFAIAILRGHHEVARAIFQIAEAQYSPVDHVTGSRYQIDLAESDLDDDDDDDAGVRVFKEIVDEDYTIADIQQLSNEVKSAVSPVSMLQFACQNEYGFSLEPREIIKSRTLKDQRCQTIPRTAIQYAIFKNDPDLLDLLIQLNNSEPKRILRTRSEETRTRRGGRRAMNRGYQTLRQIRDAGVEPAEQEEPEEHKLATFPTAAFAYAIRLGRTGLLAQIIKLTGAGLPLGEYAEANCAESQRKPKYYQGISVRGLRRRDWADAVHRADPIYNPGLETSPLLYAAQYCSYESVEWFLGDEPEECYLEWAEANIDNPTLRDIEDTDKGFDAMIEDFLYPKHSLAIHSAILGTSKEDTLRIVKQLITRVPEAIDVKAYNGYTPLHLSFSLRNEEIAKELISKGADQMCRFGQGNNLIHGLLCSPNQERAWPALDAGKVETMIELIDPSIRSALLLQRTRSGPGAATPLALWVHMLCQCIAAIGNSYSRNFDPRSQRTKVVFEQEEAEAVAIASTILKFSNGEELGMVDGGGDTPLHHAVRGKQHGLVKLFLSYNPSLLLRENATGQTPLDVVREIRLKKMISGCPSTNPRLTNGVEDEARLVDMMLYRPKMESEATGTLIGSLDEEMLEKTWKVCEDAVRDLGGEGKSRRLVSLQEANEVAKRLAGRKDRLNGPDHARPTYWNSYENDEISRWFADRLKTERLFQNPFNEPQSGFESHAFM